MSSSKRTFPKLSFNCGICLHSFSYFISIRSFSSRAKISIETSSYIEEKKMSEKLIFLNECNGSLFQHPYWKTPRHSFTFHKQLWIFYAAEIFSTFLRDFLLICGNVEKILTYPFLIFVWGLFWQLPLQIFFLWSFWTPWLQFVM